MAIVEWRQHAPWIEDWRVEQDLIITRALVEMFSRRAISARLAFRGGTALHKLYVRPGARYSEDIDLVQVSPEPIGPTLDVVRAALEPWLGEAKSEIKAHSAKLVFKTRSEDVPPVPLRLKIEINTREHFAELGWARVPLTVDSQWFRGGAEINTFHLDELLGTKLRALYQRRKGRDLFDLWQAVAAGGVDPDAVVRCFHRYVAHEGSSITRGEFAANLEAKLANPGFIGDMGPLLRGGDTYDAIEAARVVRAVFIERLSDDR
jgi:predicted nucleotidyltransferase component of viral defense system